MSGEALLALAEKVRGRMRCPLNPLRDCIPVSGRRKRYCARVAQGLCQFPVTTRAAS
jgi:hypothetical protein